MNKNIKISIFIIIVLSLFVVAVAPVLNTARIGESIAYTNTDLTGYCNGSDADNDSLKYFYKWFNESNLYKDGNSDIITNNNISEYYNSTINTYKSKIGVLDSNIFVGGQSFTIGNVGSNESFLLKSIKVLTYRDAGTIGLCDVIIHNRTFYYGSPDEELNRFSFNAQNITTLSDGEILKLNLQEYIILEKEKVYDFTIFCDSTSRNDYLYLKGDVSGYSLGSTLYSGDNGSTWSSNSNSKYFELNGEYLIDTISSTYTNKGETWTFSCLANDGTSNSTWVNSTPITISNSQPLFTQINFTRTIPHQNNILTDINVTDLDDDTITYELNDTNFDINSTGYINKTNDITKVGTYNVSVTINDTETTNTGWIFYNITNEKPIVSTVAISPNDPRDDNNLTITNTTIDANNDTITAYSVKWYKNNILNSSLNNLTTINSGNLTLDDTWIVNLRAFDGLEWSDSKNSSEVTISDQSAPSIIEMSPSTGTRDSQLTLQVKLLDDKNVTAVNITLSDPDDITVLSSQPMTYSESVLNLDTTRNTTYIKTYTPLKAGTYTATIVKAVDEDSNVLTAIDDFTIIVTAPVTPPVTGGGGGGGTPTVIDENLFSLEPNSIDLIGYPGKTFFEEFRIVNDDNTKINVTFRVVENENTFNWMKFDDNLKAFLIELDKTGGFERNEKFVRYEINVPKNTLPGNYTLKINIKSGNSEKDYDIKLRVDDRQTNVFTDMYDFFEKIGGNNIFIIDKDICISDFSETGECEEFKNISFQFKVYYIYIFLISLVTLILINEFVFSFVNIFKRGKKR